MAKHLIIHGRVQGVGFRDAMRWEAERLSVTGWVQNRRDGTVEAVVAGSAAAVTEIVQWAHRGPPAAQVTQVVVAETDGTFAAFEWRSTA
jgi:acylphosphatase